MKKETKSKNIDKQELNSKNEAIDEAVIPKNLGVLALLKLGSSQLLAKAIEEEISNYLGRGFYEHRSNEDTPAGHRHGVRKTRIDTPIGSVEYDRPRVMNSDFESQIHTPYMRRPVEFATQVCDMYVNGVSTRKVKKSLESAAGKKLSMSKSTVSRITKKLVEEFHAFQKKDLSNLKVAYLLFDAIRVGLRIGGQTLDSVMIAFAILEDGSFEVLSIGVSQSESNRSWGRFVSDLKRRGLKDPLLCITDGNLGLLNSIEENFKTSLRQRCVRHKMQNVLDAIPKEHHVELKKKLNDIFYNATSLEQAKLFAIGFKKNYIKKFPTAVSIFENDLDQCLTYYIFPRNHWKKLRTSNKIERLNLEVRRRMNAIGRHPSEEGALSLIYQVTKNYAFPQQRISVNELIHKLWQNIRTSKLEMIKQLSLDLEAA
jgi:putative transposase